jgi:hypothetical protein
MWRGKLILRCNVGAADGGVLYLWILSTKTIKPKGRQDSALEPHESHMQVLNTKHELKKDLLAC